MSKSFVVTALLLVAVVSLSAQAVQIPISNTSTNTTWAGLDDSEAGAILGDDPVTTLDQTTLPPFIFNAAPSSFTIAEGDFGAGGSLGQSFLATKGGPIGNVQMYIGGAANLDYDVHLYNLGASPAAPSGGTSYDPGALTDLMPADSWFRFGGSSSNSVWSVNFSAAGLSVPLTQGNTYVWEIVSRPRDENGVPTGGANPSNIVWHRNVGGTTSYLPYGQAFRSRGSLNGNPDRSFAMAVSVVPEPATMALVGLALVGMAGLRRRK